MSVGCHVLTCLAYLTEILTGKFVPVQVRAPHQHGSLKQEGLVVHLPHVFLHARIEVLCLGCTLQFLVECRGIDSCCRR